MTWLQITTLVAASLGLTNLWWQMRCNTRDRFRNLSDAIESLREDVTAYQQRYIADKDEFYYKWNRDPGRDDDGEILEWCLRHKVRFSYKYDGASAPYGNSFAVWITEPRLAMEFKLRWHE